MLYWCKHIWRCFIHLLALAIDFMRSLIDSYRNHLLIPTIRIGKKRAMQRLRQIIHHVVGDDRRAGDQQSLALLSPARWCWFLLGGTFLCLPDNAFPWQRHHLSSPYVGILCPRPYILCPRPYILCPRPYILCS